MLTTIPSFGQLSATTVTKLTAETSGTDFLVNATTDAGGNSANKRYIRFFYAVSSDVSNINYISFSDIYTAQINPYTHTLSNTDLNNRNFVSGTTVYVKAYGESFWSNSYIDGVSGKTISPQSQQQCCRFCKFCCSLTFFLIRLQK